jgi:hypothetical protein
VAGRVVDVGAERFDGWLQRFAERHGPTEWRASPDLVVVTATDGARAECEVPFPPLVVDDDDAAYGGLPEHVRKERCVGVLLVRLGGHAAGVFSGSDLTSSKVGSRLVHGRNAAGGQSQQRFARRREGQVRVALQDAASVAVRILLPVAADLDAVVLGGDRRAVETVMSDARLAPLRPLVVPRLLDVPDPRLRVLKDTPRLFRSVRIRVVDPVVDPAGHDGDHRDPHRPPAGSP